MIPISRRGALAALAAAAGWRAVFAQDGGGSVRLVVPFGPGTTTDIVGRLLGEALGRTMRQNVVVDNRAGAGGSTGTDAVAKAAGDGRTLVLGTVGTHGINASLFTRLPYDPIRDFAPIGYVGHTPTLLVVGGDLKTQSLKDLAALAARPEGATFASAGNGTSGHLAGELLAQRLGGRMIHVPYKEGAAAVTAVIAGQVDFMFYHPAGTLPHLRRASCGHSARAAPSARPRCPMWRRCRNRACETSTSSPGSCSMRRHPHRQRCSRRSAPPSPPPSARPTCRRSCASRASSREASAPRSSPSSTAPRSASGPSS
jgi:tripartite-type tricarboxylate transporter receptor subunit TctC